MIPSQQAQTIALVCACPEGGGCYVNGTETGFGFLCGFCTVKQHAGSKDKNIFKNDS